MNERGNDSANERGNVRLLLLLLLAAGIAAFFVFDLNQYLSLERLQSGRANLLTWVASNPVLSRLGFFAGYVLVAALSLPGAVIMTLAAGAFFGLVWGFVLVSFASALGATAAMVLSRKLVGEWVQQRYAAALTNMNTGLARDGGFYLFSLRMVPLFPFFVINLVMGLTQMRVWPFYWISQLGMIPGTLVFVFAGTQIAEVASPGDILSPGLIAAFTLLGLFPLVARKALELFKARRARSAA